MFTYFYQLIENEYYKKINVYYESSLKRRFAPFLGKLLRALFRQI